MSWAIVVSEHKSAEVVWNSKLGRHSALKITCVCFFFFVYLFVFISFLQFEGV